ncbi:MAG: hypothetical protein WCT01_00295 [Candidatus Shapirobacteria bacterium]|jgi:hypothetical protein
MAGETQKFYESKERTVRLNPDGLTPTEMAMIVGLATQLFDGSKIEFKYALDRCTFFAEYGYDVLVRLVTNHPHLANPRIEGSDKNPFDQHYWLAVDLVSNEVPQSITLDPIFGYVGLAEKTHNPYYDRKRIVTPHVPAWEGGVRIKTISI